MARFFSGFLLILTLVTGCATEKTNVEVTPAGRPVLTDAQVQRYLNSYLPVQAMASEYWGKRRYTPPNKMLPRQGTFERAISEMRAAGSAAPNIASSNSGLSPSSVLAVVGIRRRPSPRPTAV